VLGTYQRAVGRVYIALNDLAPQKFIEAGMPRKNLRQAETVVAPRPGKGPGGGGLRVRRVLRSEKGIASPPPAWEDRPGVSKINRRADTLATRSAPNDARLPGEIEYLGASSVEEVIRIMGEAEPWSFRRCGRAGVPKTIVNRLARHADPREQDRPR